MDASSHLSELFPRIEPYETGMIDLTGGHHMYWEQSGNPEGQPVIFLHGGPGAGSGSVHRRFFDPRHYRIVIFDQRGAGRSTPAAEIRENTTQHLIADIERLRVRLGIDRWLVFGGSWGAALALAYGIEHMERCQGFVLRGIFAGRRSEVDWFLYGMRTVFPEAWRRFAGHVDEDEQDDLLEAYHRRLTDPDPARHLPAAGEWSRYESDCSTLLPRSSGAATGLVSPSSLALARIEAHYFRNNIFLDDGTLLAKAGRLRHLPAVIVQGRFDMVCPVATADALARAWPGAEYVVVSDAGHSALEPGIRSELIKATEKMKAIV